MPCSNCHCLGHNVRTCNYNAATSTGVRSAMNPRQRRAAQDREQARRERRRQQQAAADAEQMAHARRNANAVRERDVARPLRTPADFGAARQVAAPRGFATWLEMNAMPFPHTNWETTPRRSSVMPDPAQVALDLGDVWQDEMPGGVWGGTAHIEAPPAYTQGDWVAPPPYTEEC